MSAIRTFNIEAGLPTLEAAAMMEKDLAEDLRGSGYSVTGGH